LENQCPGKARANLAPTPVPSPDPKINYLKNGPFGIRLSYFLDAKRAK
jgi:hypothetical protein